ncbi:DUF6509 family protein [Bacillus ectoiniformans]|uniref:DUF6509 family protein n=1 Tax=Bacillus ectoiniformans TaxID=1494429 RepID=UPI00195E8BED|nr:DUF6509 family protein [Bacillus ectoiniformans]
MNINRHTIEVIEDPFELLTGDRFELRLYAEVDEEDELYTESGFYIRVLYLVENGEEKIINYFLHDRATDEVLDFELEEDEITAVEEYCKSVYAALPEEE